MTLSDFYPRLFIPAAEFAGSIYAPLDSPEARCQVLATWLQETGCTARRQVGGPARGFGQAEPNGVLAVLQNPQTQRYVIAAARALCVGIDRASIYTAVEYNDPLMFVVTRLLLLPLPEPLPAIGDEDEAWRQYCEAQRPGKPSRERWAEVYPQAVAAIQGACITQAPSQTDPLATDRRAQLSAIVRDIAATLQRQIAAATDAALPEVIDRVTRMTECETPTHQQEN